MLPTEMAAAGDESLCASPSSSLRDKARDPTCSSRLPAIEYMRGRPGNAAYQARKVLSVLSGGRSDETRRAPLQRHDDWQRRVALDDRAFKRDVRPRLGYAAAVQRKRKQSSFGLGPHREEMRN